jgi:hypothetical protein
VIRNHSRGYSLKLNYPTVVKIIRFISKYILPLPLVIDIDKTIGGMKMGNNDDDNREVMGAMYSSQQKLREIAQFPELNDFEVIKGSMQSYNSMEYNFDEQLRMEADSLTDIVLSLVSIVVSANSKIDQRDYREEVATNGQALLDLMQVWGDAICASAETNFVLYDQLAEMVPGYAKMEGISVEDIFKNPTYSDKAFKAAFPTLEEGKHVFDLQVQTAKAKLGYVQAFNQFCEKLPSYVPNLDLGSASVNVEQLEKMIEIDEKFYKAELERIYSN